MSNVINQYDIFIPLTQAIALFSFQKYQRVMEYDPACIFKHERIKSIHLETIFYQKKK